MKKLIITSALALAFSAYQADAITISSIEGGAPLGVNYLNFDNLTPGATGALTTQSSGNTVETINLFITPNAQVAGLPNVSGIYASPLISGLNNWGFGPLYTGADNTSYLSAGNFSAQAGAGVEITFNSLQQYLGILWGSIDNYNTLTFYNGATVVDTVLGAQVTPTPNGSQNADGTRYVNINTTSAFNRVVATSSQFAFEFDNIAYNSAPVGVPDGGMTVALLGVAMSGLAFIRRKVS